MKKELQGSDVSDGISYGTVMSKGSAQNLDIWDCRELSGTTHLFFIPTARIIANYEQYVGPREKNGLPPPPSKRALEFQPLAHTGCPRLRKDTTEKFMNTPYRDWDTFTIADITPGMIIRWEPARDDYNHYYCVTEFGYDPEKGAVLRYTPLHSPSEATYYPRFDGVVRTGWKGGIFQDELTVNPHYQQYIGPIGDDRLPAPGKPQTKSKEVKGKVQSTLTPPEEDPAIRERREKQLLSEISKRQAEKKKEQQAALEKLDQEKVAEERKLLQSACLALAYAFGSDAPDACDTEYADIIQHMAADVVLGKIAHKDAVAAITERICADSEKRRALDIIQKGGKSPADPEIDKRLARVEGDIKNLGDQISTMTTHMESVLKRWEAISPFIPRSAVRYYEQTKGEKGAGVLGISSIQTGTVEQIPTDMSISEMHDTAILYVKNGLCIHFKDVDIEYVHNTISEAMGITPDMLWGYDPTTKVILIGSSDETGFDRMRCFDLVRKKTTEPFAAAGGRIPGPRRMVSRLQSKLGDRVKIVIPEGVNLA
ncbi:MAG: cell envelope integrity protein TolA [Christensenellaceae bacterium]|nr:cell envelope integrity protein TolA [Christensenellaceae bacterium]